MAVDKNKTPAKVIRDNAEVQKSVFPSIKQENKRQIFFYGMIAVDVFGFRNVERDANMMAIAAKIIEETGREDGSFTSLYAERIAYVSEMYFDFSEETPQEYKNLEKWWGMVKEGVDASECYVWYVSNIPNYLTNLFGDAVDDAHKIWKPAAQRTVELEEKAKTDPN